MVANLKEEENANNTPIKLAFADGAGDEEYVIASRAREMLGITKVTMARLIREGTIPTKPDKLDKRVKWVNLNDVKRLLQDSPAAAAGYVGSDEGKRNGRSHAARGDSK